MGNREQYVLLTSQFIRTAAALHYGPAESTNGNLFFWYFPHTDPNAPTLLWLQGGPGGASTFFAFNEGGPFRLTPAAGGNFTVETNPYSWTNKYSLVLLDNPVGTGFSYTDDNTLCTDKSCYGNGIAEAMFQVAGLFPAVAKNPFFITGESYGGKYVPMGAWTIHESNAALAKGGAAAAAMKQQLPHARHLPLKGVAIGDGWVDPVTMVTAYTDLNAAFGLMDREQAAISEQYVSTMVDNMKKQDFVAAYNGWDAYMNGDLLTPQGKSFWVNITGCTDYFNIMRVNSPASFNYFSAYLNQPAQRKALHVGDATLHSGSAVERALIPDVMQSVKAELDVLMQNYNVLLYSGQLDVIIGALLTDQFVPTLVWPGAAAYTKAQRNVWQLNDGVAGYAKQVTAKNAAGQDITFVRAVVRGAGHIVPFDAPAAALDMVQRFVDGTYW